jgi:beta-lysine N6-acetyltransferase
VEPDQLEKLSCGSLLQHGPLNDRIYLMKLSASFSKTLPQELLAKAHLNNYSKIFIKVSENYKTLFESAGFVQEAVVPGLFNRQKDGLFMAFYIDESRATEKDGRLLNTICELAISKANVKLADLDSKTFKVRMCKEKDAQAMSDLYSKVFASYPFPIDDPHYLVETMRNNVEYYGIEVEGELIALASSEKDSDASNVEMTDFATVPEWRGHQLGIHLLNTMEKAMILQGIKTSYTIARAYSHGMNITFSKRGYQYGGRLKNNTNIFGTLESMNVWYKELLGV